VHHGENRCVAEYRGHDGPDRRSKRWSPEPQTNELKNSEVAAAGVLSSRTGSRHKAASTSMEITSSRVRLFASRAGVHVDFHADRHFDDFWSLPGHFGSPFHPYG
jgi:hypothetical protein